MNILEIILCVVVIAVLSPVAALFFGWISGIYASSKESVFRNRAVKLFGRNGQKDEFLIVTGDPTLVGELYEIIVATSRRAEDLASQPPETDNNANGQ